MDSAAIVLVLIILLSLAIASIVWRGGRADSMLTDWAQSSGLRMLAAERRTFFKGPFFWTSTKGQMIFYVTVEETGGQIRHAWVRCGGYWLGMLSDNFEVRWED